MIFKEDIFKALCTCHPFLTAGRLNGVKELCCMNDSLFYPLIAAGVASVFCFETKGTNAEAPFSDETMKT